MRNDPSAALELAEIGASFEPLADRADALLGTLRRVLPFDGAWIAFADPPHNRSFTPLATTDLDAATVEHFRGPVTAHDMEMVGANRHRPAMSNSDLPYPAEELATWADCLLPAGYNEGLGVALYAPGYRHVGHLGLLFVSKEPPSSSARHLLGCLMPTLARAIDPMRSLLAAARLVHGATAGVALREDGVTDALPGLQCHALLAEGSTVVREARAGIGRGHLHTAFLWPVGGSHAPGGHVRITALAVTEGVPAALKGVVLMSPAGDLRGLTARELEILGFLIEGCSNREIARSLIIAQRTVAAHLEHILVKLSAPTRTLAAVRAEREGLYVPRSLSTPACPHARDVPQSDGGT
ncbi:MAG: transcriptional regulator, LuxR family [Blastococcus sp.]|jgi:DNA-binding CsgD family transcriptional regulator|nr:transcriptional regulator, LuxR family [Blastococcus sp.]